MDGVDNGNRAIELAKSDPANLILMEIALPGMDDYETWAHLKADERTKTIPVIFISALGDLDAKVKAFQVGGVDNINKPLGLDEIKLRVGIHVKNQILTSKLKEMNLELTKRIEELTLSRSLVQECEN